MCGGHKGEVAGGAMRGQGDTSRDDYKVCVGVGGGGGAKKGLEGVESKWLVYRLLREGMVNARGERGALPQIHNKLLVDHIY